MCVRKLDNLSWRDFSESAPQKTKGRDDVTVHNMRLVYNAPIGCTLSVYILLLTKLSWWHVFKVLRPI